MLKKCSTSHKKRQDERKAIVIIAVTKDTILYMCLKRKMFYRKRANFSFQKKRGNIEKSFSIRKRNDRTFLSITSNPRIEHQKTSSLSSQLLDEVSLKALVEVLISYFLSFSSLSNFARPKPESQRSSYLSISSLLCFSSSNCSSMNQSKKRVTM